MKKVILILTVLVQVSGVFSQTHFVKGFVGPGYEQMTIVIKNADIGGVPLQIDDEIAVFDGNLCVGVVVLTGEINSGTPETFAVIKASSESSSFTLGGLDNGFNSGNKMYFRFWDNDPGIEYHNVVPIVKIVDNNVEIDIANEFVSGGTVFVYASTANTTKTWTGADDEISWNNAFNWDPEGIPEPSDDVETVEV